MINSSLLRGKIYTKCKTMSECADEIGWTKQRLHNIMTGKQDANVKDIKILQEFLSLSESEIMDIFLPNKSQTA